MEKKTKTHHSVSKALEILKIFIPNNQEKPTSLIAKELDLNTSTVSRLLGVLLLHGFLTQNPDTKRYSLGKINLDLGKALQKSMSEQIVLIAKPYIDQLRDFLELDVGFELMVNRETILVYRAWGTQDFRAKYTIGERLPVHISAGARIIMAHLSRESAEAMLKGPLAKMTPHTIIDKEILLKKLIEFRKEGIAYDMGELDEDYLQIAAPVFNYYKEPVAAVVVGIRTSNANGADLKQKVVSKIKETAKNISSAMFYKE